MARFDIYEYGGGAPFLLDVQADLLADFKTRVVVPLWPLTQAKQESVPKLKPVIKVKGKNYILMTTEIGVERTAALGPVIANVEDQRQVIIDALDFLFQGF